MVQNAMLMSVDFILYAMGNKQGYFDLTALTLGMLAISL